MSCADLMERAGIEDEIKANSMLVEEVHFSDRKDGIAVAGVERCCGWLPSLFPR
jgi:hypothetical protein